MIDPEAFEIAFTAVTQTAPDDSEDDEPIPLCTTCGAPVGIFPELTLNWRHFHGAAAASGAHQTFDPGHFVTVALREEIEGSYGGRVFAQSRHHLDVAGRIELRPDILWRVGGLPGAVIDAKYKAEKPSGYPNADLYQLLAYCTVLGLRSGHLVYAAGNEEPARHVIRQSETEIVCHALHLSKPAGALLAEVSALAARIADD